MVHVTLFSFLKSIFTFTSQERKKAIAKAQQADHAYIRGDIGDRGPCPGLNALANQGYLPRDGKNISISQVETALMAGLHMSTTLSSALARALRPLCRSDGTFDLYDMRKHNVVEHDRSFTRLDIRQGDNFTFQPDMFQALLDDAKGGPITIRTLAKTYVRRKKESKAAGSPRLPLKLWAVNLIQTVSFFHTAKVQPLTKETMTTFYTEERFPDEIVKNTETRTLVGLIWDTAVLLTCVVFRR
ncbi:Cloroperoxidase [Polyplosphaeria fusca]|uniref:Cloroperoxidase n=1 Tax=Polyplosphaeria fusca TaxID=682080 RepID=A0A9P4UVE6_9PLEO|nr:Cloroperoxidase [Polyplosphaeria fusca]